MTYSNKPLFIIAAAAFIWINVGYGKNIKTAFRSDCERLLLDSVHSAKSEILIAVYSFSNKKIAKALIKKSKEGIVVKLKVDKKQSSYNYSKSVFKLMKSNNLNIEYISMQNHYSMHNKFLVIDKETVVTGSYNFTKAATKSNWENLILIRDRMIAQKYIEEWETIRSKKEKK